MNRGRVDRRAAILALGVAAVGMASLAAAVTSPTFTDPDEIYAALQRQRGERLGLGRATINVVFADGAPGLDRTWVRAWVARAAMAVIAYFGHFPVTEYGLLVVATPGDRVGHATTYGYAGSVTVIHVGVDANPAAYRRDWVLVHEMVHTALPNLPRRALWLQEGNATYAEPIARAQVAQLAAEEVWRESVAGMPQGNPGPGDAGMDGTKSHARLYWGGATFWLLAEIAIYESTRAKHSLRDALRAMNWQSGGNTAEWSPEQLMIAGDSAIGTVALLDLYHRFATTRVETDLPELFARLGVRSGADESVTLNNAAPLAALRRRITAA